MSIIKRLPVVEEKIRDLLEEKYQEEEFADCFTVEIKYNTANKKLQVFTDSDSGMTFRKCQRLSRFLESYIDEENWLGEKYTLEVSSPGVDRPLLLPRQYQKNIGRRLEVDTKIDDKKRKGILTRADEQGICLEFEETRKQGKKKIKEKVELELPYEQITKAIVKISF
jgi:ribosome maturation factor RimP